MYKLHTEQRETPYKHQSLQTKYDIKMFYYINKTLVWSRSNVAKLLTISNSS